MEFCSAGAWNVGAFGGGFHTVEKKKVKKEDNICPFLLYFIVVKCQTEIFHTRRVSQWE